MYLVEEIPYSFPPVLKLKMTEHIAGKNAPLWEDSVDTTRVFSCTCKLRCFSYNHTQVPGGRVSL